MLIDGQIFFRRLGCSKPKAQATPTTSLTNQNETQPTIFQRFRSFVRQSGGNVIPYSLSPNPYSLLRHHGNFNHLTIFHILESLS
jgi:hypothetical protein